MEDQLFWCLCFLTCMFTTLSAAVCAKKSAVEKANNNVNSGGAPDVKLTSVESKPNFAQTSRKKRGGDDSSNNAAPVEVTDDLSESTYDRLRQHAGHFSDEDLSLVRQILDNKTRNRRNSEKVGFVKGDEGVPLDFPDEWLIPYEEMFLIQEIGRGSFGVVYRGFWRKHDVAIKQVLKVDEALGVDERKNFEREARLMMSLEPHQNVCLLYGVCKHPLCLVTEFYDGGDMFDLLHSNKTLTNKHVIRFCKDIVAGLSHLHKSGIIHRDLRSANIVLTADWTCKLVDFGLSRPGEEGDKNYTTSCYGPLKWMAPEALERHSYSTMTDIYALGVTVSEFLNREEPYPEMRDVLAAHAVINQDMRPNIPAWTPPELAAFMKRCWARDRDQRPQMPEIQEFFNNKLEKIWR